MGRGQFHASLRALWKFAGPGPALYEGRYGLCETRRRCVSTASRRQGTALSEQKSILAASTQVTAVQTPFSAGFHAIAPSCNAFKDSQEGVFFNSRYFPADGEVFMEEASVAGQKITFETGKIARLCAGAVVATSGNTKVLATVVCAKDPDPEKQFMPLQVDYREKSSAGRLIPKTFMRREGAPKEREILCSRIIDRSVRSLFPPGFYNDVQVMANVLCSDGEIDPDVLSVNAVSAALMISDVPWVGPIGSVRIARIGRDFIVNPNMKQLQDSDLNLVYSCTAKDTVMFETQSAGISNEDLSAALRTAHEAAQSLIKPQQDLAARVQYKKREAQLRTVPEEAVECVRALVGEELDAFLRRPSDDKMGRGQGLSEMMERAQESLEAKGDLELAQHFEGAFEKVKKELLRRNALEEGVRVDGRGIRDVRKVQCEVATMPGLHGSSLFSRGNTQMMATVTVGASEDAQRLDSLVGPSSKRFMVHYSFPPFSINEIGRMVSANRREIGHGALAEKALLAVLPSEESYPLSIRITSECTASDGSSSMATICAGSLSLMDAGIPIREHVAGVSVGLITDYDHEKGVVRKYQLLTDILGLEDHLGDMDFKIAGTRDAITAIQLDMKLPGIPLDILCEALRPAQEARAHILDIMDKTLSEPRQSNNSPRAGTVAIERAMVGKLIGSGGSTIKAMQEELGVRLSVIDEGIVSIFAANQDSYDAAVDKIMAKCGAELEIGSVHNSVVVALKDFGAFVELEGGQTGLLHISEISHIRVGRIEEVLSMGQSLVVELIGRDPQGALRFSRRSLLPSAGPRDGGNGGSWGGGRGGSSGGSSSPSSGAPRSNGTPTPLPSAGQGGLGRASSASPAGYPRPGGSSRSSHTPSPPSSRWSSGPPGASQGEQGRGSNGGRPGMGGWAGGSGSRPGQERHSPRPDAHQSQRGPYGAGPWGHRAENESRGAHRGDAVTSRGYSPNSSPPPAHRGHSTLGQLGQQRQQQYRRDGPGRREYGERDGRSEERGGERRTWVGRERGPSFRQAEEEQRVAGRAGARVSGLSEEGQAQQRVGRAVESREGDDRVSATLHGDGKVRGGNKQASVAGVEEKGVSENFAVARNSGDETSTEVSGSDGGRLASPAVGEEYQGRVKSVRKSGVVVEVDGKFEGVLRMDKMVEDSESPAVHRGQDVRVRCLDIPKRGKVHLQLLVAS